MKKMYRFPFESVFESKKELRKEIGKLEETTDEILINSLISERRNTLNPYAPLNERLKKLIRIEFTVLFDYLNSF